MPDKSIPTTKAPATKPPTPTPGSVPSPDVVRSSSEEWLNKAAKDMVEVPELPDLPDADADSGSGSGSETDQSSEESTDAAESNSESPSDAIERMDLKELKAYRDQIRQERLAARQMREQHLRGQRKLAEQKALLEQNMSRYQQEIMRLQAVEKSLRDDPYGTVEKFGGSFSDWQRRVLSGETGPNPDVVRTRNEFSEVVNQLKQEIVSLRQERQQEQVAAVRTQKVSDYVSEVITYARQIPELSKVKESYLSRKVREIGESLAAQGKLLDPEDLAVHASKEIARERAEIFGDEVLAVKAPTSPTRSAVAVQQKGRKTPNNASSTEVASPIRSESQMTREEWLKWAGSKQRWEEDDDDEL